MEAFPAFFPLAGRKVAIVGDGEAAEAKAALFANSPAEIVRLDAAAALSPQAYAGALLAFVAGGDEAFARAAAAAARQAGALVNVVDRPALCDFTTPAVIDRGEVVAAVGTGGAAPMLAALLRSDIEARVPEGAGRVAALLRRLQDEVRAALPDLAARRAFLRGVLSGPAARAAAEGDTETAARLLREALASPLARRGRARLVAAAGPADLLTLRAARALAEADVVVAGAGIDPAVEALARRDARRTPAAAVDAAAAAEWAAARLEVVVLSADPARDGVAAALETAGMTVEPIPAAPPG